MNYYNEIDTDAADWLEDLIRQGEIPPGVVDRRDIRDIRPDELSGFTQCHFFAGIGGWPLALRLAGWPSSRRVWTGSCPCQPFSAAGRGDGFVDERHLWPHWYHLIRECEPDAVFGEQVASKDGLAWLDLVFSDLQGASYAFAPVDLCAAGVGSPQIRQRLFFGALRLVYLHGDGCEPGDRVRSVQAEPDAQHGVSVVRMDDRLGTRLEGHARNGDDAGRRAFPLGPIAEAGLSDDLGNGGRPGQTNGFWADADWLFCRDAKWRPVEPGSCAMADGLSPAVVKVLLRGFGNAISPEAGKVYIEAFCEAAGIPLVPDYLDALGLNITY